MYSSILVPLDESPVAEQVLPYVISLAVGRECRVTLLEMIEPSIEALPEHKTYFEQQTESARTRAVAYLDKLTNDLKRDNVVASSVVQVGKAADGIISYAETNQPGLIAMTTHGQTGSSRGLTRWLMGSVTDRVVSYTKSPLLVVRVKEEPTASSQHLSSLIVPLDGSAFAEAALSHARTLAEDLALEVVLLRIIRSNGDNPLPPSILHPMELEAENYLSQISQAVRHDGQEARWIVRSGLPADQIVAVAQEVPGSLVVIASHGRSGLGRWVLGSVAAKVLRTCDQPVLLIHPEAL